MTPRRIVNPAVPLDDPREERFAQLRAGGMPRIVAHGEAGWEPDKGNAKRVEQRPRVAARIAWMKSQGAAAAVMTAADVRRRQEEIANFNVWPYLKRHQDGTLALRGGVPVIDWDAMGPEAFAAVSAIDNKAGKVTFYDRTPYLRDIGKQEGLGSSAEDAPVIPPDVLAILGNLHALPEEERRKKLASMAALSAPGDLGSENDIARMIAFTLRRGGQSISGTLTLDGAAGQGGELVDAGAAGAGATDNERGG